MVSFQTRTKRLLLKGLRGALESVLWSRRALLELRSILKQISIYLNLSRPITSNKYDKGKRHQKRER